MLLIGARVIVLCPNRSFGPQWKSGFLRASGEPLGQLTDLLIPELQVCVEFDGSEIPVWVCLTDSSFSQAVYIEDCLVWAKRILPQRPMGVAWPARAFKLLIGQAAHAGGSLVIEYLMDSERATVPLSQIKPLTADNVRDSLAGHQQLLNCLEEIEDQKKFQEILSSGALSLVGQDVEVFRCFTRPWFSAVVTAHDVVSKELTVQDSAVLMPYTIDSRKVQIKLPQGLKVGDVLSQPAKRSPSRRSSLTTVPISLSIPKSDVLDQLDVWSSPSKISDQTPQFGMGISTSPVQLTVTPSTTAAMATSMASPMAMKAVNPDGNNFSAGRFRVPSNDSMPFGGQLSMDKRAQSLFNIDRLPNPGLHMPAQPISVPRRGIPFGDTGLMTAGRHAPPTENIGMSPPPLAGQLLRSVSHPVLCSAKQALPDLDHIVSIISRDQSVSNLNSNHDDVVNILQKPDGDGSGPEETDPPPSEYAEELQKSLLSAKSMPALNRVLGGQTLSPYDNFVPSPAAMPGAGGMYDSPLEMHPLREFRSEVNLASWGTQNPTTDFFRDFSRPYQHQSISSLPAHSMTSLLSDEMYTDSDSSHDLHDVELGGKRSFRDKDGFPRAKRGRGRPKLSEDEKHRRKELRDLGLLKKNKKRRTREELEKDRLEKQLHPKQRGRKKGCKRGTLKNVSGVLINLGEMKDGDEMLQIAPCSSFVGVGACMECWPNKTVSHQTCRFVEFRRLRVAEALEESLRWEVSGFAVDDDAKPEVLAPWIPLRAGYSGMGEETAFVVLQFIAQEFINVVEKERLVLVLRQDDAESTAWKGGVHGVREVCDVCYTTLFSYHYVCYQCGFAICPDCYSDGASRVMLNSHDIPLWTKCVPGGGQPHLPKNLQASHIIPKNILWELTDDVIQLCKAYQIPLQVSHHLSNLGLAAPIELDQSSPSLAKLMEVQRNFSGDLPNYDLDVADVRGCPLTWLCDGSLLQLLNPTHPENINTFNSEWLNGKPVVISNVQDCLDQVLWSPQAFCRDFGNEFVDLVDCRTGMILPNIPSKQFWIGFDSVRHRLRDHTTDEPMLLKLKDWPPSEDFGEKLPRRFKDIMQALPLGDYTRRDGKLNMASSLPLCFVKPDLGPKMYIAYGSPYFPNLGTTNLHLDMSDAVNVLVYANCAEAMMFEAEEEQIMQIVQSECCQAQVDRIRHSALRVGAIWHIYSATDAGKIREFLNKFQEEQGIVSQPGTDPIHDQRIYLSSELRLQLERDYGVKGWAIAQCIGDAIFIPAGAPHQVRNVCSCIKVAEDFVSPQHIPECLKLTEEFRHLSDLHNNHEDKLQVKNIIYHALKDAVGALLPQRATHSK